MKVGVAGLGAMGSALAARLMEVGHDVSVWNRSVDKAKPLASAGAKVADTPAALVGACDAVLTILTDGAAIEQVYNGPNGLLSGDVKGKLLIEMSTVAPKVETDGARPARLRPFQAKPLPQPSLIFGHDCRYPSQAPCGLVRGTDPRQPPAFAGQGRAGQVHYPQPGRQPRHGQQRRCQLPRPSGRRQAVTHAQQLGQR